MLVKCILNINNCFNIIIIIITITIRDNANALIMSCRPIKAIAVHESSPWPTVGMLSCVFKLWVAGVGKLGSHGVELYVDSGNGGTPNMLLSMTSFNEHCTQLRSPVISCHWVSTVLMATGQTVQPLCHGSVRGCRYGMPPVPILWRSHIEHESLAPADAEQRKRVKS